MNLNLQVNNELFGGGDAVVKYVLEGHDRWVARHSIWHGGMHSMRTLLQFTVLLAA